MTTRAKAAICSTATNRSDRGPETTKRPVRDRLTGTISNRSARPHSLSWSEVGTADMSSGKGDDGCWSSPRGAVGYRPSVRRGHRVRVRLAAAEEMTEVVQFSRATKYLTYGLLSFLIIGAAVLALSAGPLMLTLPGVLVLFWWRLFALKVVFAPNELVLVGLASVRRFPRTNVLRVEEGAVVVVSKQGRERRITIPLAMGVSTITDNSPDARVKQRIDAAYRRWLLVPAQRVSG